MTPARTLQVSLIAFVVIMVVSTTYAFAAGNTVLPATGGDGASDVSGYTITNVSYSLDATDPTKLDGISFTLNTSARSVRAKLSAAGSTWYTCNPLSGNDWSCNTPGATTISIDQLRVTASSK